VISHGFHDTVIFLNPQNLALIICIANINQVVHKPIRFPGDEGQEYFMIWLYRILFPFIFLLGLPFYLLRMFRRGGYGPMMKGRFGFVGWMERKPGVKRIWIQAVSVGELLAIESLVKRLHAQPDLEIVLSTTTSTGYQLAKQKYGEMVLSVISFPLDFWFSIASAWNRIDPDVCVITEAELWPEHIHTAQRRGVPLILINARLSDKSYRRLSGAKWFRSLFYAKIRHIGAGSKLDAERILNLGFPESRLTVTGNLKFDVVDAVGISADIRYQWLKEIWGTTESDGVLTLIGASTWSGEEKLLLDSLMALNETGHPVRLLLTPRHAERRAELKQLLETYGDRINWKFRSRKDWKSEETVDGCPFVYVADTTGELKILLQLADIAVIGRSFPPHTEGQTPIEAAALGVPVVYGPSLSNFRSICRALETEGGACRISNPGDLTEELRRLIENPEIRQKQSAAARRVFDHSKGSTDRTMELILSHF